MLTITRGFLVVTAIAAVGLIGMNRQLSTKAATDSFDKKLHSITDPASPWIIVNKQHPLQPATYEPDDLKPVGNGQYLRVAAAKELTKLLSDASRAGHDITPESGYRSYELQKIAYTSEVEGFGQEHADQQSARPGYSEHQTGWGIDLGGDGCSITDCFGDTPSGKWVAANAYKYGFIVRYTPSKTNITGYRAESWHFRYIGPLLAREMHDRKIETLEEFFGISGGTVYN